MLPWGVTNDTLDLKISSVKETIKEFCQYRDRLEEHPNKLAANLM